jgi:hypothetical protein
VTGIVKTIPALLALLALLSCGGKPGEIAGTVTFRGEGLEGVAVEVYLRGERSEGGTPFMTAQTGPGGKYALTLPPGGYYLWAKEAAPAFGPRKIGEHPKNPIRLAGGDKVALDPIELRPVGSAEAAAAPSGAGIAGRVLAAGNPVADATVMIYGGSRERLMGPGYVAVVRSDESGRFQADLAAGEYKVAVRKRRDGSAAGFLRAGDLSADYEGNPVAVRPGEYADIGDVTLHPVDRERLAGEAADRHRDGSPTRLRGRVADVEGKPLAGQFVFAYRDEGMIGRPDILTTSDEEGGFVLNLAEGGRYYLGARDRFGGPRQPGELVGKLAGSPDSSVEVADGEVVEGLKITMEEMW